MVTKLTKQRAIERLVAAIRSIDSYAGKTPPPKMERWQAEVVKVLEGAFDDPTPYVDKIVAIHYQPGVEELMALAALPNDVMDIAYSSAFRNGINQARSILLGALHDVNARSEDPVSVPTSDVVQTEGRPSKLSTRDVFLVHGHDNGLRETVARFLESLGLKPIILHEPANQGRTIIEKFVDHADVAYAVVLLTPDDKGESVHKGTSLEALNFRARQNVVLELGYFLGKLGRSKVCALVKGDIEKPSDYSGVLYVPYDEPGSWRLKLARELKAAGLDVAADKLLS